MLIILERSNNFVRIISYSLKQVVFIPLLLLISSVQAQRRFSPDNFNRQVKYNDSCQRNTNYPLAKRMKKFPFNKAASIQLISFDGLVSVTDSGTIKITSQDPALLGVPEVPLYVKERVTLNAVQIDSLTDILYNYGYIRRSASARTSDCYAPRNAIIFIAADGKVFAFIEMCFMCLNTRLSDERISLGELCENKLQLIRQFFGDAGVTFGIEGNSDRIGEMEAVKDESLIEI